MLLIFASGPFPSRLPFKVSYTILIYPVCATFSAHLILLDLLALIIFDEVYNL
jgi:hypothetical protein